MARHRDDDVSDEQTSESAYERERLRGVAPDEDEFEEVESEDEDVDDEDESTF